MTAQKDLYLVALPCFHGSKGFNHRTILVAAKDERDACAIAYHLRPNDIIGDIKRVNYTETQGETK
jgi:hypothetical protein